MNSHAARQLESPVALLAGAGLAVALWGLMDAAAQPRFDNARRRMVDVQLKGRDVRDAAVLRAMLKVPRHRFMPEDRVANAYEDRPLPIGLGQTISQPYIVAKMTELAGLTPGRCRVLEVGTGSGYQAAVLAELGCQVYSIEIIAELSERAATILKDLGYARRVHLKVGDGYAGWPKHGPYDAVIVTAAPPRVPPPLEQQLAVRQGQELPE